MDVAVIIFWWNSSHQERIFKLLVTRDFMLINRYPQQPQMVR